MKYRITVVGLNGSVDQVHFNEGQYEQAMCYFDTMCNEHIAYVLWLEYGNTQWVMCNKFVNPEW